MFCRTKKVKEMIDGLKDEIENLKDEVKKAKEEPTISYGEEVVPVYFGFHTYHKQETLPVSKVVEMLLAHSGMEIVKEPQKDEKIIMRKKPKAKKAT